MVMEMFSENVEFQHGNFLNQLKIPHIFNVDLSDHFLWCTVLVMFCDSFSRSLVGLQESQRQVLTRFMSKDLAFFMYCSVSYSYNILAFFFFHKAVGNQPRVRDFMRNEALIIGYIFLLFGLCIKAHVYSRTSIASIMGGNFFKLDSVPRKIGQTVYDPYYHPLGTTSAICYFGFSVVRASAAGIMLTIALGVGLCIASKLERYFLKRVQKQQLEQYTFIPINRLPSDLDDKHDENPDSKLD